MTMLDERKASILRAVVEEYIQTAQPVGSGHVAKAPGIDVSSATVRNEMAALEGDGYLTQPHTSAGRIPTEKGYREFVDALAEPSLDRTAQQQVRSFFDQAHGEIERMLADTTRLLAGLTDYAAVVVGPRTRPRRSVRCSSSRSPPRLRCSSRSSATVPWRSAPSTCPSSATRRCSRRRPST
ncbi:MAG: hypothetical protein R2701_06765 [Acidimicrobiales bacterium]